MTPLGITGTDLVRALRAAAAPRIEAAVRERAEGLAAEHAGGGIVTRIYRVGAAAYAVSVEGTDDSEGGEAP